MNHNPKERKSFGALSAALEWTLMRETLEDGLFRLNRVKYTKGDSDLDAGNVGRWDPKRVPLNVLLPRTNKYNHKRVQLKARHIVPYSELQE
jgi:hypothetical protein